MVLASPTPANVMAAVTNPAKSSVKVPDVVSPENVMVWTSSVVIGVTVIWLPVGRLRSAFWMLPAVIVELPTPANLIGPVVFAAPSAV